MTAETTSNNDQPAWYCLRVRPLREQVAAKQLAQRVDGVDVFAPRIRISRTPRSGGVIRQAVEALFPGYFFAQFRYPEQVRHVLSTHGVNELVSIGDKPREVDPAIISFLRDQVSAAWEAEATPSIAEGDWVRVVDGAFRNTEGRVLGFDSRTDRVRLLLSVLGREVQISLSSSTVVPRSEPTAKTYPAALRAESSQTTG